MFHDIPCIGTTLEAFDELSDVRMTLSGASSFALALAQSGIADRESLQLLSCLLDYCSLATDNACCFIQDAHQNAQ